MIHANDFFEALKYVKKSYEGTTLKVYHVPQKNKISPVKKEDSQIMGEKNLEERIEEKVEERMVQNELKNIIHDPNNFNIKDPFVVIEKAKQNL